jgi:hypothetical protein
MFGGPYFGFGFDFGRFFFEGGLRMWTDGGFGRRFRIRIGGSLFSLITKTSSFLFKICTGKALFNPLVLIMVSASGVGRASSLSLPLLFNSLDSSSVHDTNDMKAI